jgi:hypothetical protein
MPETHALKIPIWVVTPRSFAPISPDNPCDESLRYLAFSHTGLLARFMESRQADRAKYSVVEDRTKLLAMLDDLKCAGTKVLYIDPQPDGSGGTPVSLDDMLALTDGED